MGPMSYQIELPPSMKRAHNVFLVSNLIAFHRCEGDSSPLTIVIDDDGNQEQEADAILDKKKKIDAF